MLIFFRSMFFSKKKRENPLYTLSKGTKREKERKRIIKQMMLWVVLYVLNSCQTMPQRNYYSLMHITDRNRDCVTEPPDQVRVRVGVDRCSVRNRWAPDRYLLLVITRDIHRSVEAMFDVPVLIADRNRSRWTDTDCFHHRRDHPTSFWSRRTRDSTLWREAFNEPFVRYEIISSASPARWAAVVAAVHRPRVVVRNSHVTRHVTPIPIRRYGPDWVQSNAREWYWHDRHEIAFHFHRYNTLSVEDPNRTGHDGDRSIDWASPAREDASVASKVDYSSSKAMSVHLDDDLDRENDLLCTRTCCIIDSGPNKSNPSNQRDHRWCSVLHVDREPFRRFPSARMFRTTTKARRMPCPWTLCGVKSYQHHRDYREKCLFRLQRQERRTNAWMREEWWYHLNNDFGRMDRSWTHYRSVRERILRV